MDSWMFDYPVRRIGRGSHHSSVFSGSRIVHPCSTSHALTASFKIGLEFPAFTVKSGTHPRHKERSQSSYERINLTSPAPDTQAQGWRAQAHGPRQDPSYPAAG